MCIHMSTSVLWDLRNVSIPEICRFVLINSIRAFCKHGPITQSFWAHDAALESGSSVIVFLKALHFFISQPVGSACNGTSSRSYIHVYIPNSTWSPIKSYLGFWMWGTKDAHFTSWYLTYATFTAGPWVNMHMNIAKTNPKNLSRIVHRAAHFKDVLVTAQ